MQTSTPLVLPVAIIGAGVSGLYTALLLQQRGIKSVIFEARPRIGGRVVSVNLPSNPKPTSKRNNKRGDEEKSGGEATPANLDLSFELERYDLGPSWFWPSSHYRMSALVKSLRLPTFPQYQKGAYTVDMGPNSPPMHYSGGFESDSMRVGGGMRSVVDGIASQLASDSIHLRSPVSALKFVKNSENNYVLIRLAPKSDDKQEAIREFKAGHVIFAMPPRLIAEGSVELSPKLPKNLREELESIPTWMAPHGKFVAVYDNPFWRERGLSGSGSSRTGPLGELHDATPMHEKDVKLTEKSNSKKKKLNNNAAIFGFMALGPSQRKKLGPEKIKELTRAQLKRMFSPNAPHPTHVFFKDWALDPYTASKLDVSESKGGHPDYRGLPRHAEGLWNGRLHFAGTEVAPVHGGFLEGALSSAEAVVERIEAVMETEGDQAP
ncbi:hypothetical protein AAMO2058_001161100 [Amorphochlora amoebiformis]|mmetsp:Transcript_25869/g.40961  ORF Transcript_25869/g.40961 Transcript_25869/m.40961 type:complete len:436 (-) Transcript_25869:27-1334(-)